MQQVVVQTKARSGWSARQTLGALEISRGTYYRWLKEAAWGKERPARTTAQAFEALAEEREAVLGYARQHPTIRHRELAWRMVDEDVAYVSPSTVYRILRDAELVCRGRGRRKRYREEMEKASRPDQRWGTDLMYLKVHDANYFYLGFIDEYSRYIVHWELLSGMDGERVSLASQAALETLPRSASGELLVKPEIRSDNGSCFLSREFHGVLEHYGLTHVKIKPHCPEENGIMERSNRTLREALEEEDLDAAPSGRRDHQDRWLVQHGPVAQQPGLLATDRLLPRRACGHARSPPSKAGRRAAPAPREELRTTSINPYPIGLTGRN